MRQILASCAAMLAAGAAAPAATEPVSRMPFLRAPHTPAPSMLGTTAIPIRAGRFGADLQRARAFNSALPFLQQLIGPARKLSKLQKLAYVQRAVQQRVRWMSDSTQWGRHDYWASAAETLASGAGDMEDRAIVKLQTLRALGFDPNDLFLTFARDRVGGAESMLTVRLANHYYILDDFGGSPFEAEGRRFELVPILSFGWTEAWVHVREPSSPAIAISASSRAEK